MIPFIEGFFYLINRGQNYKIFQMGSRIHVLAFVFLLFWFPQFEL